jgi:hypothetical protein
LKYPTGIRFHAGFPFFLRNRAKPLRDGKGNWDHLNLIFPVYLKLMTGFPSFHPEDVGAGLLH